MLIRAWIVLMIAVPLSIDVVHCKPPTRRRRAVAAETVFDVTKYGAKGNGRADDSMAIIRAWNAACKSKGGARVLIPKKQFMAAEIVLSGPCTARKPITIDIQGTLLAYDDISAYSNGAWIMLQRVDGVVITGGGTIDGRGDQVWHYAEKSGPRLPVSFVFQTVNNAQMYNLNFLNSMGFHSKVTDSNNISITKLKITAPSDSPNTDGIHLSSSVNVNITDSVIGTGDDCISVGHGTHKILVARIFCGPGHGLSIGSLGKRPTETSMKDVTIINCTLTGTTNGARIKTYHASPQIQASSIYFEDLVMNQVKNAIVIDQHYNSKKQHQQSKVKLSDIHFRNIRGTTISEIPIDLNCSSIAPCERVELSNINLRPFGSIGPLKSTCSNAKFFVTGKIYPPRPAACV